LIHNLAKLFFVVMVIKKLYQESSFNRKTLS